ncbi:uncharacterized protein LOC117900918 [Drosophila subobscura]|uniref:uncharacterized protein LOC117900918 n=1 Tax=Drosophila subobscura TaxID=7241 RepID=UPI00155B0233|nr:uncharacterized protein LOC117900918 [Drosophila subobscura]
MKLFFTLILCIWMQLASSVTYDDWMRALEIDAMIKAELENIKGFVYGNAEYKGWHSYLIEALAMGLEHNQKKLANLQSYQKYNSTRLDLENQLWRLCNDLQLKIRGFCYKFYRTLRDDAVRTLKQSNADKASIINKIQHIKCDKMQKGKEEDYA